MTNTKGVMRVSVLGGQVLCRSKPLPKGDASMLARRIEALGQYSKVLLNLSRDGIKAFVTCLPASDIGIEKMLEKYSEASAIKAQKEGSKYVVKETSYGGTVYNPATDMVYQVRYELEGYYSCTCPHWGTRCYISHQPCKHICEFKNRKRGFD